jgi:thiamine-monophosphate kinase
VRLADLTEADILARIVPRLPRGRSTVLGPGDDAAVLQVGTGATLVVTTDVLVEDRHFRRAWSTGRDVGWRAAVQNLADVAAMGATPTALVVALAAPPNLGVAWVEDLADGLAEACSPLGVGVVGGDLSSADQIVVAVTALGMPLPGVPLVARSGARPGNVLALAGATGWAAAGAAFLAAHSQVPPRPDPLAARAVAAFRRPAPPLGAGPAAARAGATAMLDVSDGLLLDAGRLAQASGVIVQLNSASPVLAETAAALAPLADRLGADPGSWVLTGGEDHALLASFPDRPDLPAGFEVVGHIAAAPAGSAGEGLGVALDGRGPVRAAGWDHFAHPGEPRGEAGGRA